MTNYKKVKDRKALNQKMGENLQEMSDDIEEATREKCDAMLWDAQKEAGDVRQQAQRAAEATRQEAAKEASEMRRNALEVCQQAKDEAEALIAAARQQAEQIRNEAKSEREALLGQSQKESREIQDRAKKEAEAIRERAVQAARVICQNTLREARVIYLDLQDEMNQMIDGINQAQNSFMKSYKEVHQILDTIPGKLIQLDGEEEELEEVPAVPADQKLLLHMEEILGEGTALGGEMLSEREPISEEEALPGRDAALDGEELPGRGTVSPEGI